ncbi:MAG: FixH family protein [Burkholderiaceae bacterium]
MLRLLLAIFLSITALPALSQPRAAADVACKPAGKALTYDCSIKLNDKSTGKPIEGAKLTVGADMPSMPMAHNVRPVTAKPGAEPGTYTARVQLEMHGDWALKLRLSAPVKDQIIKKLRFE